MYIDRRYRPRRRSPWPWIAGLMVLVLGSYLVVRYTNFIQNPFSPVLPTPTPTRSATSYLADAEEAYQAGKLGEAAKAYARVAELEPNNADAFAQQAWLFILLGHPDQAIGFAQKAVALDPSAYNLSILAMAQDWNGQYDDAIKTALKAVDKDPLSAEAHAVLAEVYADKNNWGRALDEAKTAAKLKPDSALVQRNLGYVLERQGRHEEAIAAYLQAASWPQNSVSATSARATATWPAATTRPRLVQFQKAVEANPDSPVGYDALGHGSALAGDPDRAISMLRKSIDIDPTYGQAFAHLGRVVLHPVELGGRDRAFRESDGVGGAQRGVFLRVRPFLCLPEGLRKRGEMAGEGVGSQPQFQTGVGWA